MPRKYHESSPSRPQNSENTYLRAPDHELCPHESISYLSHLEQLTACFSDTSIRSFAGATSGVASSVIICPLDVVKTKLQGRGGLQLWTLDSVSTRRSFRERGLIGTGRAIWNQGGLAGMYQGLGPTMLANLPRGAIYFTVYHKVNDSLKERYGQQRMWASSSVSAVAGGTCSILLTNPLWVIKTRLMSQSPSIKKAPREYKSAIDVARKMYCREGVASFYLGLTPALLGVTHLAVQFPLYEQFKRCLTGSGLGNWHEDQGWLQVLGILTASSASKACATAVTYPHEVIRTRLQTQRKIYPVVLVASAMQSNNGGPSVRGSGSRKGKGCNGGTSREKFPHLYRGIISTLARILREEGWRALYSGMGTSLLGAIPASATTMLVYEIVVRLIKKSRTTGNRKLQLQGTIE
ncbi:mitochondrial carrier domain-containing protein [Ilyonectria robusta]|uniref:mitochondrial carrier domain-containing protein n=1 Tax=Ilyonectria robusta TaxID=1079257 RepID=UPI001E8D8715|nr:mitochondrial carrier domain-containing protein [Ilyonectria robusta]KAH8652824.1 mitochondrial carrier domain-containing protein [Ilyonectria robusta]